MNRTAAIVIGIAVVLLLILGLFALGDDDAQISSFQECVDAGNPIQETNPRRCSTEEGVVFVEPQATDDAADQTREANGTSHQNEAQEEVAVSVYYSKEPESNDNFEFTEAVDRTTTRSDVGTFAIEELIDGPTAEEREEGLFSPLTQDIFTGASNCENQDFTLNVNDSTATLQFCRRLQSAGVGQDARIQAAVTDTLAQFSTVNEVVILTRGGDCFGDMSGQNRCLQN